MKTVIIGGVAGGASTAARLRRMDEHAEILMLERGPYVSFANCGLPYHIGEVIQDREKLLVVTPQDLKALLNIDARVNNEVIRINRAEKTVTVRDLQTSQTYKESYDKLVLSPGAAPIIPPLPGVSLPGVFTLRNLPDMDAIKAYVDQKKPARAVVVGGGFIGLEGVDKRIDVIATAMGGGLSVFDLEELELSYAPPFGSARDPVNILGFTAANVLLGDAKVMTWDQVDRLDRHATTILDVRLPEELALGMIDGALHIPLQHLREMVNEIPKDRPVLVYCQTG